MKSMIRSITRITRGLYKEKPIILILAVYFVVALFLIPSFSNPQNLANISIQSVDLIILACGLTFVVLNGGIDFSIPAVIGLGSVIGASIMTNKQGYLQDPGVACITAIAAMLLIGIVIGAINGVSVVCFKMPSFITTMASYLVFGGLALFYTKSETIIGLSKQFLFIGEGSFLKIPVPIIIAITVIVVASLILNNTIFGRQIYSVGTNQKASHISGIPVKRNVFLVFVICGFIASVAGIVMTSRVGAGLPVLGREMILDIITAVIIGGTSVFGGIGSIIGSASGAAFIVVVNNSLDLLGVPWYVINTIKGAIIMLIALVDAIRRKQK